MPPKVSKTVAPAPVVPAAPPVAAAPAAPAKPQSAAEALGISEDAFAAADAAFQADGEELEPGELEEAALAAGEEPLAVEEPPAPAVGDTTAPPAAPGSIAAAWDAVKQGEQRVMQMSTQLRRQTQEVEKLKTELQGKGKTQEDVIAALKADPRNLEKLGIPLTEFLDRILNDNTPTVQTAQRQGSEEVATLRKELGEVKQMLVARQTSDAEMAFRSRFRDALQAPEFELLREHPNAESEAIKYATGYYQQHGRIDLTPAQIAKHLQDTWQEHIDSLGSSKAVRKRLGLPDTKPSPESTPPPPAVQTGQTKPRTVTTAMASAPTRGAPPPVARQRSSDEEILRAAMKLVPANAWEQVD